MLNPGGWQELPVFIASTFRDMDDERDILARIVFPVVNSRLRDLGYAASIYPVDLRWGIETSDQLDEAARQRTILSTCVDEVRRCRPLFIGLLGDRYGWVPPAHLADTALAAAGLPDPGLPLSATVLELLAAVHAGDDEPPILLSRRTSAEHRRAAEESRGDRSLPQRPRAVVARAPALNRVESYFASLGHAFQPYTATWSQADRRFESAEFIQLATDSLLAAVERLFARTNPQTWLDGELIAQRLAAHDEARHLVGRTVELGSIARHWIAPNDIDVGDDRSSPLWRLRAGLDRSTIAIVGPSGVGKSALLAKIAVDLEFEDQHRRAGRRRAFVRAGLTAASERLPVCVLLLLAQFDPLAAQQIAARHSPETLRLDDVMAPWLAVLRAAPDTSPILVVIDALDQLVGAAAETTPVAWIPTSLGDRVRFVVSALDDTFESVLLRSRPNTIVQELTDLPRADAEALVRGRVEAHHRSLPPEPLAELLAKSRSPRWLVVAADLLLTLTAYDYLALRDRDETVDAEAALRRLLVDVAAGLPTELDELHQEVFDRLIDLLGPRFAEPLRVLGVAPAGLDEPTLRATLELFQAPMPEADLALLRAVFSAHLHVHRGEWRFRHRSALEAAFGLLAAGSGNLIDAGRAYRDALAHYLQTQPPAHPMRVRYLLPLLLVNGYYETLAGHLADSDATPDEAVAILTIELGSLLGAMDDIATEFERLCEAAPTERGRLTIMQLLCMLLPALPQGVASTVMAQFRALLGRTAPASENRFGLTPENLTYLLTLTVPDLREAANHPIAVWLIGTMVAGRGDLRDAPVIPLGDSRYDRALGAGLLLNMFGEYAVAVAAGVVEPAPTDAALLRGQLDIIERVVTELPGDPTATDHEFLRLHLATVERAAHVAWPAGGFRPLAGDFDRCHALNDRVRGNGDVVILLARSARIHALTLLRTIDDSAGPTEEAARIAAAALTYLDEARWQLEFQLTLTADAFAVQVPFIQNGMMSTAMLGEFGQHGAAYAIGLAIATQPRVVDIVGWPAYAPFAAQTLAHYGESYEQSQRRLDPSPLIRALAANLDRRGVAEFDPQFGWMVNFLLLAAALSACTDGFDDATVVIARRTLVMVKAGAFPDDPDDPAAELIRGLVEQGESALVRVAQERADGQGVNLDVASICSTLDDLRRLLIVFDGGTVAEQLGLALSTAIRAGMLSLPVSRSELDRARLVATGTGGPIDDHARDLVATIRMLLTSVRVP